MGASDLTIHNKQHEISPSASLRGNKTHTLAHFLREIDGGGGEKWQAADNTDNLPLFILS